MSGDERLSSDDLIRRARERLQRTERDSPAPSSDAETTDDDLPDVAPTEPPAPLPPRTRSDRPTPTLGPTPSDDIPPRPRRSDIPRPGDAAQTYDPTASRPPSSLARIGLVALAIAALAVGGLAVAALFDSSRSADSLDVGDCLRAPEEPQVRQVDIVDCAQPHEFEVIGFVELTGAVYPGDRGTFDAALERCEPVFERYVGAPPGVSDWFINVLTPSAQGWDEGDRRATCLAFRFDEDLLFDTVEGSIGDDGP